MELETGSGSIRLLSTAMEPKTRPETKYQKAVSFIKRLACNCYAPVHVTRTGPQGPKFYRTGVR